MSAATAHLRSIGLAAACPRRFGRAAAVARAVAATLTVSLFAGLAGVDLEVRSGASDATQHVGPASVALASLFAGLAAWGLLATVERIASRPRVTFTRIAVAALVVSLAGPIGLGLTAAAATTLVCIHLTAAAVLIPGMTRSAPMIDRPRSNK
jgi:hypothetical protein